jgi:hypothetical protein
MKPKSMATILTSLADARGALLVAAQTYGFGRRTASKGFTDEKFITAQHNLHATSEAYARAMVAYKRWMKSRTLRGRKGGKR